MNKKEVQKRVLQNGQPLALDKFEWNEKARVFSTTESNLVLDFKDVNYVTFDTGHDCTFTTGYQCVITTGYQCVITTGSDCVITTGFSCTFTTGSSCTFDTGSSCTFTTGSSCTFTTGSSCTFDTGSSCTFDTGFSCTFNTNSNCTFTTSFSCTFTTSFSCVVIRSDVYEVIELKEGIKIKLNGWGIKGYKEIPDESEDVEIIVDGKTTIISRKSAVALGLVK